MSKKSLGLIAILFSAAAYAECPPTTTLSPSTPYVQQTFGTSAAFHLGVNGTRDLLIGAPRDSVNNVFAAGAVTVFHYDTVNWAQSQLLTAPNGASCDFGRSISIFGSIAAIGAPGSDGGCDDGGAVYFTSRDLNTGVWSAPQRLVAPGTQSTDWVGRSVSIIDNAPGQYDWMVAGAEGDDSDLSLPVGEETQDSGAVHVWRRLDNGPWGYWQRLRRTAPLNSLAQYQAFGASVALAGNELVVGCPGGELSEFDLSTGLVMMYALNGANQWVSVTGSGYHHPLTNPGDSYGDAVAGSGGVFVIGAPTGDSTATDTPLVGAKTDCGYIEIIINGQNGVQSAGRFFPPDATNGERFGYAVAIRFGEILVGTLTPTGKVYVYRKTGNSWNEWALHRVLHNDRLNTSFGSALATTYDWIAAPDPGENYGQNGSIKGIAYLYRTNEYTDATDSCARAAYNPLYAEGTYTGCSTEFTLGAYTNCGGVQSAQGPDLFYGFTAKCSGPMTANTIGSSFDTVLSVHSTCPPDVNPLNPSVITNTIVCNDDDAQSGTLQSRVTFNAVEGETYLFRIAGYNGQSGEYIFNLRMLTPPANDDCANAIPVGEGAVAFATCGAVGDGPYGPFACEDQPTIHVGRDIWYTFTAPSNGTLTVHDCSVSFDSILQIFPAGMCPPTAASSMVCRDESSDPPCNNVYGGSIVSAPVAGGASYLIRVGSHGELLGSTGHGTLVVDFTAACACDWNGVGGLSVQDIFDFLAAYFQGHADFNNSGTTTVQDIFDFLACYFGGCP